MMTTPLALTLVGAEILPLTTTYDQLGKILQDKHKINADIVKQIPRALADPIAIFDSEPLSGKSIVVLVSIKDENGNNMIVPVRLNKQNFKYTVNEMSSAYFKDAPGWLEKQINDGRLLYVNKQKTSESGMAQGALLLASEPEVGSYARNIATEADLVKARAKYGNTLYQRGKTLLAPNGKLNNLSPEAWAQVRTPEFKAWFVAPSRGRVD